MRHLLPTRSISKPYGQDNVLLPYCAGICQHQIVTVLLKAEELLHTQVSAVRHSQAPVPRVT